MIIILKSICGEKKWNASVLVNCVNIDIIYTEYQ